MHLRRLVQSRTVQVSNKKSFVIPKATVYNAKPPRTSCQFKNLTIPSSPNTLGVHVATALNDSKVLTVNKQHYMVFDHTGNEWEVLPVNTKPTKGSRLESLHTKDGNAFLFTTKEVLRIDAAKSTAESLEKCPLDNFVTARVGDTIYAVGSTARDELFNNPVRMFKFSLDQGGKGSWSPVEAQNMHILPRNFAATATVNGDRVIGFFTSFEETAYVVQTRMLQFKQGIPVWVEPEIKGARPTNRSNVSLCSFVDPSSNRWKVLLYGGSYELYKGIGGFLNDLDIFDAESMQYEGIPHLIGKSFVEPRAFSTLTPVGDKNIIILGGHNDREAVSNGYRFELSSSSQ